MPRKPRSNLGGGSHLTKLISFDIDGTLEVGDPPGSITMKTVRKAKELGYLIGSSSDRTISSQQRIWRDHDITVDFTVLKHHLAGLKTQFRADEYYHVGDSEMDRYFSDQADFRFLRPDRCVHRLLAKTRFGIEFMAFWREYYDHN